jgi:Glycoside hydrolase 123, catalytic domain
VPHFEIFMTSSLEKVFPDTRPAAFNRTQFTALQGEVISFQIVYRLEDPSREDKKLHFNVSLEGAPVPARFRTVELVPSQYPCRTDHDKDYLRTAPGLYPDLLLPSDGRIRPIENQYRSLWVDIKLENVTAGSYPMICKVTADKTTRNGKGEEYKTGDQYNWERKLDLRVLPISLPDQKLIHTEWFHVDCLADYYNVPVFGDEHWRIMENFIAAANKDCGVNMLLTPVFTPPLDTEVDGERTTVQLVSIKKDSRGYHFDFKLLKRWCRLCRKHGISYLEIAHFFTQWGAKATPKIMALVDGQMTRIFGWDVKSTSTHYRDFLVSFIPGLISCLAEEGFDRDHVYFHISDEPSEEHADDYVKAKEQVSDLLEGFTIIDALSSYALYEKGVVSHPIPGNDEFKTFYDHKVPDLWVYYCVAQGRDVPNRFFALPSARNRIMGILLYLYEIKGFLHWGFNYYNSAYSRRAINPFLNTDSDMAFPSGDSFLVYPSPDGTAYSSIRNEVQMAALEDLRLLTLLEEQIGRKAVVDLILGDEYSSITFTEYPKSSEYLLNLREKIISKISETVNPQSRM